MLNSSQRALTSIRRDERGITSFMLSNRCFISYLGSKAERKAKGVGQDLSPNRQSIVRATTALPSSSPWTTNNSRLCSPRLCYYCRLCRGRACFEAGQDTELQTEIACQTRPTTLRLCRAWKTYTDTIPILGGASQKRKLSKMQSSW